MKKFIEGSDGTLVQDTSYVGEDAWDDDADTPSENVKQIIDRIKQVGQSEREESKDNLSRGGWLLCLLGPSYMPTSLLGFIRIIHSDS